MAGNNKRIPTRVVPVQRTSQMPTTEQIYNALIEERKQLLKATVDDNIGAA